MFQNKNCFGTAFVRTCTTDCCCSFVVSLLILFTTKAHTPFESLSLNLNKRFNSYLAEIHNQKDIVKEFFLKQMEVM
jgi:hypothetical protein